MRKLPVLALSSAVLVVAGTTAFLRTTSPARSHMSLEPEGGLRFDQLPPTFVENRGQAGPPVSFYLQGAGSTVYFTPDGLAVSPAEQAGTSQRWGLSLDFVGADPVRPSGRAQAPGAFNYLKGEPRDWVTGVPTYSRLVYEDLWPGIDLTYRGRGDGLKYSFRVAPGADPSQIRLAWRGASAVDLTDGGLEVATPTGTLADEAPVSYQAPGGERVSIPTAYSLRGKTFGFELSHYDRGQPLVIDPAMALEHSTLLGGSDYDAVFSVAVDGAGARYVAGQTRSVLPPFPTTPGVYDTTPDPLYDAVVAKLNPSGSALEYATFLGGADNDAAVALAVDATGSAYVAGETSDFGTPDFPTTPGAFDTDHNGGYDAFVAKLNPSGSTLVYSTFLGGIEGDQAKGIAVDEAGAAYVTGDTIDGAVDFPTSPGAYNPTHNGVRDVFVTKLNPSGSALAYSTFLGGGGFDYGDGIAVDASGAAFVTGQADSDAPLFPTTPGAFDVDPGATNNGFVTKLAPSGSVLVYSTLLGGTSADRGLGVAVDDTGAAHVTGYASPDFPTTVGAYDTSPNGSAEGFVTKLNSSGSALVYSTLLGGGGDDYGWGIAVDGAGAAYVTGQTEDAATDFPTTAEAIDTSHNGEIDAFVTVLNPSGSGLESSTFLGGSGQDIGYRIVVDGSGAAHVAGETEGGGFPTTPGAFDTTDNGDTDAFLAKLRTLYRCMTRPVTHLGSEGNDVLTGGKTGDVVLALGGKDTIRTRGGADRVCAGGGNDTVNGGSGKDRLLGEAGRDRLKGGGGNDRLNGGKGTDLCSGGGGKDKVPGCEKEKGIP